MSQSADGNRPDLAAPFGAFEARLQHAVPFREDALALVELRAHAAPALEALLLGARERDRAAASAQQDHEALALLHLLGRRAGELGTTPSVPQALAHALAAGLEAGGCPPAVQQRGELALVLLEGYCAGRDELRERELREREQGEVCRVLAPGCSALFLVGSHPAERLEQLLEERSRQLFRTEVRSLLFDVSQLDLSAEECARALLAFVATITSLGTSVLLAGGASTLEAWRERLALPALEPPPFADFEAALGPALAAAGYELRSTRGRARQWLDRVRPGQR